jgi:hypothetical protein
LRTHYSLSKRPKRRCRLFSCIWHHAPFISIFTPRSLCRKARLLSFPAPQPRPPVGSRLCLARACAPTKMRPAHGAGARRPSLPSAPSPSVAPCKRDHTPLLPPGACLLSPRGALFVILRHYIILTRIARAPPRGRRDIKQGFGVCVSACACVFFLCRLPPSPFPRRVLQKAPPLLLSKRQKLFFCFRGLPAFVGPPRECTKL